MSYIGSKRSSSLVSATEITLDGAKLKSSGDSITKSDGTTAVLSESGGVVTLNNGTIGSGVTFPAGHVIQYKRKEDTTSGDFNLSGAGSTTAQATGLSESIACLSGSKLIISVETQFITNDPQYGAIYYIYKDNGSGTYVRVTATGEDWYFSRASDATQTYMRAIFSVIDLSPSTSTITYKLYAMVDNTSQYFRTYQSTSRPAVMTLMEVSG